MGSQTRPEKRAFWPMLCPCYDVRVLVEDFMPYRCVSWGVTSAMIINSAASTAQPRSSERSRCRMRCAGRISVLGRDICEP